MRKIIQLEEIVNEVSGDCTSSVYETLERFENGELTLDQSYMEILEAIVYDILKTPKR